MTLLNPMGEVFEPAPSPQRITLAALRMAREGVEDAIRLIERSGEAGEREATPAVEQAERQIQVARMLLRRPTPGE